jgi:hypothetical protein
VRISIDTTLRLLVENLDAEWMKLIPPHREGPYFYHRLLLLVTDYDISHHNVRRNILLKYRSQAETNRPKETVVSKAGKIYVVDHDLDWASPRRVLNL